MAHTRCMLDKQGYTQVIVSDGDVPLSHNVYRM